VCPEKASSVEVLAPPSAAWVSAECRRWCRVQPPVASSKTWAARRWDRRARPLPGSRSALGKGEPGLALGQEQRAGPSSLEEPGKQSGRGGMPHDDFGRTALVPHPALVDGHVEVGHVEGEDLVDPGRRLGEHAPQGLVPQADVAPSQEPLHLSPGQGSGAIRRTPAPAEALGGVSIQPSLVGPVPGSRAQGVEVAVPGRRRCSARSAGGAVRDAHGTAADEMMVR
jgi:hypothetical protein